MKQDVDNVTVDMFDGTTGTGSQSTTKTKNKDAGTYRFRVTFTTSKDKPESIEFYGLTYTKAQQLNKLFDNFDFTNSSLRLDTYGWGLVE